MDATNLVGKTCPYCQTPIKPGAPAWVCAACGMPHHEECWRANGGCTSFGCGNAPRPAPRTAPPAHAVQAAQGSALTVRIEPEATSVSAIPPPPEPSPIPPMAPDQVADVLSRWSDRRLNYYNLGSLGERAELVRQRDGVVYRIGLSTLSRTLRYDTREAPEPRAIPPEIPRRAWPLPAPTVDGFQSGITEYAIEGSEQVIACPDCAGRGAACPRCEGSGRLRRWQTVTVDDQAGHEESLIGAEAAPPQALAAGEPLPLDDVSAPRILPAHIDRWDQAADDPDAREIAARLRWLLEHQPPVSPGRELIFQRLTITATPYTVVDFRPQDIRAALAPDLDGRLYLLHPGRQPSEHRVVICGRDRRALPDLPARRLTRFPAARAYMAARVLLVACAVLTLAAPHPWWAFATAFAAWNAILAGVVMRRQRRLLAEKRAGRLRGRSRWRQWWDGVALPRLGYTAWSALAYSACAAAVAPAFAREPVLAAILPLGPAVLIGMAAVATSRPPARVRYR